MTRTIRRLTAAFTLALLIAGFAAQQGSATTTYNLPSNSPQVEKSECARGGGTWTTEHGGSVGICTYPYGGQTRCSFSKMTCSVSLPHDGGTAPTATPTAGNLDTATVNTQHSPESAPTATPGRVATTDKHP